MAKTTYEMGVIHGRFQVLHKDHVAYLMAGQALCKHMVIGITNPDPGMTKHEGSDPKRSQKQANPLTYYERYVCVNAVMKENRVAPDRYAIVPFPINQPDLYQYYVPRDAVYFLTIYDDWGRQKLAYFKSRGFQTHVLRDVPPEEKGISSTHIRDLMVSGKAWEHLVPECIAQLMHQWDIPERLRKIE